MLREAIGAAALVVLSADAAAQQPAAQPPAGQKPAAPQGSIVVTGKKVCETILKTGSILPKRICKTQAEWDEERAATLRTLERWQSNQDVATAIRARREAEAGR